MTSYEDARASLDNAEERSSKTQDSSKDTTEHRLSLILSGWNNFEADFEILASTLDAVGEVYPFVKVAVLPFKVAVTVELKRRQNDKKILALLVTMRDMMSVLAQLLRLKKRVREAHGNTIKDALQQRTESIGVDIKTCATTCDAFQSKRTIVRALKCVSWERTLNDFASKFEEHRVALQTFLTVLINSNVEHVDSVLAEAYEAIKRVDSKIDVLLPFEKLQSDQERSICQYVEANGGEEKVLENNRLLQELLSRYDDGGGQPSSTERQEKLAQELREDMRKDIGELLQSALGISSNLFDALSMLMETTMRREGDHIVGSVLSGLAGPANRVNDPDIRKIWSGMGWKWCVNAQDLVMSLREYYTDLYATLAVEAVVAPGNSKKADQPSPEGGKETSGIRQSDAWTLKHINVQGTHPLLEAIDCDASSFVTIAEINSFTSRRPLGWSLPHWLAYWTVGFPLSMKYYTLRIQQKLQFMTDISSRILPSNQSLVKSGAQWCLHVKRSLAGARFQPFKDIAWDEELFGKFKPHVLAVEKKMSKALSLMKWFIDSSSTVALLVGSGQLESNLLILMYLISGRLVEAMRAACMVPLGELELTDLQSSVSMICQAMYTRLEDVKALCAAQNKSISETLAKFASGLYYYLEYPMEFHHSRYGRSLISSQKNPLPGDRAMFEIAGSDIPLEGGSEMAFDAYDQLFEATPAFPPAPTPSPFWNVSWQGTYTPRPPPIVSVPPFESPEAPPIFRFGDICLVLTEDGKITGQWSSIYGHFDLEGRTTDSKVTILARYRGEHASYRSRLYEGTLNDAHDAIIGEYYLHDGTGLPPVAGPDGSPVVERVREPSRRDPRASRRQHSPDPLPSSSLGTFELLLRPTYYFLHRPPQDDFACNRSKALWKFALEAVTHAVRMQMPRVSWEYFKARRDIRQRYIELYSKCYFDPGAGVQAELDTGGPLTSSEVVELQSIELVCTPNDLKFYRSIANNVIRKKFAQQQRYTCEDCTMEVFQNVTHRMLCESCPEGGDSGYFDVCEGCARFMDDGVLLSKTLQLTDETHEGIHNMLQIHRKLDARTTSEHHLRAQELLKPGTTELASLLSLKCSQLAALVNSPEECLHRCGKQLSTHFWTCIECDDLPLCCYSCNNRSARTGAEHSLPGSTHTLSHTMVRFPQTGSSTILPVPPSPYHAARLVSPSRSRSRSPVRSLSRSSSPPPRRHHAGRRAQSRDRYAGQRARSRDRYSSYGPEPYPAVPPPPPSAGQWGPVPYWQSYPPPPPAPAPPPPPPPAPMYPPPNYGYYYPSPYPYPPPHYPPYYPNYSYGPPPNPPAPAYNSPYSPPQYARRHRSRSQDREYSRSSRRSDERLDYSYNAVGRSPVRTPPTSTPRVIIRDDSYRRRRHA